MNELWIALQSIPAAGGLKVLDDQEVWKACFTEYALPYRIVEPLRAEIFIQPQETGVLFKGKLTGTVALPCDRCSEDSICQVQENFSTFEAYPGDPLPTIGDDDTPHNDVDEAIIRPAQRGNGFDVNPMAYAWEELSLALPIKPLCHRDCKGLCPICGINKNEQQCTCADAEGDPRLAPLRGLKITQ